MRLHCACGRPLVDVVAAPAGHLLVTPRAQVTLSRWPTSAIPGEAMTFTVRCTSKDDRRREMLAIGATGVARSKRRDGPRACGADWQFTSARLDALWAAPTRPAVATFGANL